MSDQKNDLGKKILEWFVDTTDVLRGRPKARIFMHNAERKGDLNEAEVERYFLRQAEGTKDAAKFTALGSVLLLAAPGISWPVSLPLLAHSLWKWRRMAKAPDADAQANARSLKRKYERKKNAPKIIS